MTWSHRNLSSAEQTFATARGQALSILHLELVVRQLEIAQQVESAQRRWQRAREEVVVQLQRAQRAEAAHCIGD